MENGNPLPLVPLDVGQYLIRSMQDMGPVVSNGFGINVRDDDKIIAYFNGIGTPLLNWEFVLMRKMCHAYLQGIRMGNDRFSIMPMKREEVV